jgi:antitoxin CptB
MDEWRGWADQVLSQRRWAKRRCEGFLMSGSTLTSAHLHERRRKILFRAWRRGIREMDLVMGQFADMNLPAMSDAEVDEFERLLEIPDPQIMGWITGSEAIPIEHDTPLFARLRAAPREALKRAERSA